MLQHLLAYAGVYGTVTRKSYRLPPVMVGAGGGCRKGFGHVVQVNRQLISILEAKRGAPIDLDNATLRVTLDVIGRVGFGKDFGATRDFSDGRANLAFDMMAAGGLLLK